ncbi:uncharacterized protein LOC114712819 [Neltuma alba]|uniref:uncharacterized protein LOC114712819 n=1 Tax=Neltuma alba TaxID=207710 RepID=UPI0010A3E5D5|nr:uncharacterized protein LOC114712819 [Prosopis alba]
MGDACDDAPECSSSFGDTGSGTDNASAFSDDEVVSYMYANDPFSSMFFKDCEPSLIRRKKLTSHWKSFIRPLRWRCKWIELKLKQLQSQKLKYEKELAAYDYRRQLMSANFTLDGCNTKSVPLLKGICGKKVMKRKKRKRAEETCNLASYTSDHYILSYCEAKDNAAHARLKNVKDVAEAQSLESNEEFKWNDGILSHVENDLLSSLDHNDTDKTLRNIFEKIEAAQSEVHKLRARIDKVVNENVGQSSSINNLNTLGPRPSNGLNIYDPKFASLSRMKKTISAGDQFTGKTKESFEEQKSVSLALTSAPDLVAKNAVPNLPSNNLKVCSSKSNVSRKRRGIRMKSGSNCSWARVSLVKPKLKE